jgi:hypothetical protein
MKIRNGFVSNSSSCSFIIRNFSKDKKTIHDFAEETKYLVNGFNREYSWHNIDKEDYIKAASNYDEIWLPGEKRKVIFGDEHGNTMGLVCDYMLRDSDSTESFEWFLHEMLR